MECAEDDVDVHPVSRDDRCYFLDPEPRVVEDFGVHSEVHDSDAHHSSYASGYAVSQLVPVPDKRVRSARRVGLWDDCQ
ncbi:hypothetical protein FRC08_009816 [Ceratobasidium sp. 394]|nr:hypothetical protein FRC08_009816 [Ceratobasidium sp. 394]KAG9091984.1 hypothetical protein FS749_016084 [Ceratobasidium sp. UAMH 11750]